MRICRHQLLKALRQDTVDLQLYQTMLNDYEQKLRYILKKNNIFIWRTDWNTGVMSVSRSLNKTEHRLSYDDFLNYIVHEDREEIKQKLKEIAEVRQPIKMTCHFRCTPYDSTPLWSEVSGIPLHEKDGTPIGYFGLARDITQWMDTQQLLRQETARAQQSIQRKTEFLDNMKHEIRTPLNAIVGFSELLLAINNHEQRQMMINLIQKNSDTLLRLIHTILEARDIKEQQLVLKPEMTDLSKLFDETCEHLQKMVEDAGLQFVVENPYPTFPMRLDPEKFKFIMEQFVCNAVKNTREGYVKLGYQKKDSGFYIYCEDTGIGIPKDKQEVIFDKFVKLDNYVQGAGLGLSICKAIADSCHGHIGVVSEGKGKGSTFWFLGPKED